MNLAFRFYPAMSKGAGMKAHPQTIVVAMHGFLGCNVNWGGFGNYLSGRMTDFAPSPARPLDTYSVLAFDWRNHGDSFHSPEHNFSVHRDDLRDLLRALAQDNSEDMVEIRGGVAAPVSSNAEQQEQQPTGLKVVLVGHSMGGVLLMDYLWHFHRQREPGVDAESPQCSFDDQVVGAVVVDVAPYQRPPWFFQLKEELQILKKLPLQTMSTTAEAERWVQAHASKELAGNTWMIRYLLSNLRKTPRQLAGATSASSGSGEDCRNSSELLYSNTTAVIPSGANLLDRLEWRCNIDVLLDQMENTLWSHPVPSTPECALPTLHVFGDISPYKSAASLESIPKYFSNSRVEVVPNASHFVHIEKRQPFTDLVRDFVAGVSQR